ncbi:MAG: hypothetical protein SFV21_12250 [Rhodospirillaceae bacterium]|nr:hypothetical protein [Rhodospirillaceae bacterium]
MPVPPSDPPIVFATSLVPRRADGVQNAAVASWLSHGARVISVNVPDEIAALTQQFPKVEFVTAERSGQRIAGRPVPFIRDLAAAMAARMGTAPFACLINSDIVLRPTCDLAATVTAQIGDGLILLPRVDLPDLAAVASFAPTGQEAFSVGYDGAFLSRAMLAEIPESLFCIGMPFWDYWLPALALIKDRPLKALASPVALHVAHDTRWDGTVFLFFHALLNDVLSACRAVQASQNSAALDLTLDALSHVYANLFEHGTKPDAATGAVDPARTQALADFYDRVQEVIVHHIKTRAIAVTVPAAMPQ